eukprot:TRINITY_DN476_c0_g1_i2.p1 TRINITY_DN476_c0_g1~~TRINITY_DN476_c0_g1_i2.p1  ORF type:complete len:1156 (+),score=174.65 TRINITY_DN476_c0_g1_i2:102-3569(+)
MKRFYTLTLTLLLFLSCFVSWTHTQEVCGTSLFGVVCGGKFEAGTGAQMYCIEATGVMPADSPCHQLYDYSVPGGMSVCFSTPGRINLGTYSNAYFTRTIPVSIFNRRTSCQQGNNPDNIIQLNTTCCDYFDNGPYCGTPECLCPRPCTVDTTYVAEQIVAYRPSSISQCYEDCTSCNNMQTGSHTKAFCDSIAGTSNSVSSTYFALPGMPCCTMGSYMEGDELSNATTPSPSASPPYSPSRTPSLSTTRTLSPSTTRSLSSSVTPSTTRSVTPSTTRSLSPSITPSTTISLSRSQTPSTTRSLSSSQTPSGTRSLSPSNSLIPSTTPSATRSVTPSTTRSLSPSQTPSTTRSLSPSQTPSTTISLSGSRTASATRSLSPSNSFIVSRTPSLSHTPSTTRSFSPSNSPIPSITPSTTRSLSPSITPSATKSLAASNSRTPSATKSLAVSNSRTPSATKSLAVSNSRTPSATKSLAVSNSRTPSATKSLAASNSRTPSTTKSLSPSNSRIPSVTPSTTRTASNTGAPSATPSMSLIPSITPSPSPTPSTLPIYTEGLFSHTWTDASTARNYSLNSTTVAYRGRKSIRYVPYSPSEYFMVTCNSCFNTATHDRLGFWVYSGYGGNQHLSIRLYRSGEFIGQPLIISLNTTATINQWTQVNASWDLFGITNGALDGFSIGSAVSTIQDTVYFDEMYIEKRIPPPTTISVFANGLNTGVWRDVSTATDYDLVSRDISLQGSTSIRFVPRNGDRIYFTCDSCFDAYNYQDIRFWVYATGEGNQTLIVRLRRKGSEIGNPVTLNLDGSYANMWKHFVLPWSNFVISPKGNMDGITITSGSDILDVVYISGLYVEQRYPTTLAVFNEGFNKSVWTDISTATDYSFDTSSPVRKGVKSLQWLPRNNDAIRLSCDSCFSTDDFQDIRFWVYATGLAKQQLYVRVTREGEQIGNPVVLQMDGTGFEQWVHHVVSWEDLQLTEGRLDGVIIESIVETSQARIYIDDMYIEQRHPASIAVVTEGINLRVWDDNSTVKEYDPLSSSQALNGSTSLVWLPSPNDVLRFTCLSCFNTYQFESLIFWLYAEGLGRQSIQVSVVRGHTVVGAISLNMDGTGVGKWVQHIISWNDLGLSPGALDEVRFESMVATSQARVYIDNMYIEQRHLYG